MAGDVISNLLEKLSNKTGRQWGMNDLFRLAQKLPELNDKNLDSVLNELSAMGLDLSEETKEKVKSQVAEKQNVTAADLEDLTDQDAKLVSKRTVKKSELPTARKRKP